MSVKIREYMTGAECPFCHMKDDTRLLYRIFESEQWICDRCLRQWTVKWDEYGIPLKPIPMKA